MKAVINEKVLSTTLPFPKLMIYEGFIVYFKEDMSGIVVVAGDSDYDEFDTYTAGSKRFVDFTGSITLSND